MEKHEFTKKQKIFLLLAGFILIGLFISSSMTYRQQSISSELNAHRFEWVRKLVASWQISYAGKVHSIANDGAAKFVEFILRKSAHFGSYFLIGFFSYLGVKPLFKSAIVAPIFVWLSITGLAAFDEFHQYLTGDRTPSISDVMLDSFGALLAITICILVQLLRNRRLKKLQH